MKIQAKITAQDSENLSRYFAEIRNFESLTKEQERELIVKIQKDNDPNALRKLINANLKFVVSVAKKYQNQGAPILDLISEGNAGMIEASNRFDVKQDIKFFSYAVWWIRIRMFTSISLNKRMIRLPDNRWLLVDRIKKEIQELEQTLNRFPSLEELQGKINYKADKLITIEEIQEAIIYGGRMPSLQDKIGDQDDDDLFQDTIEDKSLEIDQTCHQQSVVEDLNRYLSQLSQQQCDVLCLSLGLNQESIMRADAIAYNLELKLSDVAKLRAKALKRLKKVKNIDSLKDYLS